MLVQLLDLSDEQHTPFASRSLRRHPRCQFRRCGSVLPSQPRDADRGRRAYSSSSAGHPLARAFRGSASALDDPEEAVQSAILSLHGLSGLEARAARHSRHRVLLLDTPGPPSADGGSPLSRARPRPARVAIDATQRRTCRVATTLAKLRAGPSPRVMFLDASDRCCARFSERSAASVSGDTSPTACAAIAK